MLSRYWRNITVTNVGAGLGASFTNPIPVTRPADHAGGIDKQTIVRRCHNLIGHFHHYGVGRGSRVGRGLGVGVGLGVAVAVGGGVAVGVVVGVAVGVAVAVGVGVAVAVGVGVGDGALSYNSALAIIA